MKEKFGKYENATTAAAQVALYFGGLGYHTILSLGRDKNFIKVKVFTEPNEELKVPANFLYTWSEMFHCSLDERTQTFDVYYFYFEYCNK